MKYPVVCVPFIPATGMAIFPFILVKRPEIKQHARIINHEYIHLRQQLELFILPFYILYLSHYFINLVRYKNHHQAYLNIVFEREAYQKDFDLNYLNKRKLWSWVRFI